ncbi:hypothetical protein MTR67_038265 [Solanum verrucosum]|uniref:Leucine-rich repeat-containing N-terminal plant-type domain-containing protein n=1 Tax=Solanum verrucosum TaxID=315347 RepID=A0AAF0UFM3_SOLVR|nr:hypothetical protein MTR67_038265 [Solanum verrucosum]
MVGYFSALVSIKNGLVDNMKYLKDWEKGDPCTSNWTGVNCFNKAGANGYLHVKELYVIIFFFFIPGIAALESRVFRKQPLYLYKVMPYDGYESFWKFNTFSPNALNPEVSHRGDLHNHLYFMLDVDRQLDNNNFSHSEIPASYGKTCHH